MYKILHCIHGEFVHHLKTGRHDAGTDDTGDGITGFFDVIETRHHDARQLWLGYQLDGDFSGHTEHAFGAGHQREQVIARCIGRVGTDGRCLALNGYDFDFLHVVHSETVFQAMHAAGIFGYVSTDRTGDLRRRIRRVIEPEWRNLFGDLQVADAWLYAGGARHRVNADDAIELRQRHEDAIFQRRGTSR